MGRADHSNCGIVADRDRSGRQDEEQRKGDGEIGGSLSVNEHITLNSPVPKEQIGAVSETVFFHSMVGWLGTPDRRAEIWLALALPVSLTVLHSKCLFAQFFFFF